MVTMHSKKRKGVLQEPLEARQVLQCASPLALLVGSPRIAKAPEDWRSPRRYPRGPQLHGPNACFERRKGTFPTSRVPECAIEYQVIAARAGLRGQSCFLTTFTALSTGSITNFIPSGTGGTVSRL